MNQEMMQMTKLQEQVDTMQRNRPANLRQESDVKAKDGAVED